MNILYTDDTICAIATAQGGAIGTIRVSGKEAITITDKIFTPASGPTLSGRKPYTLTFGHINGENGEIVDEVLVSLFRGPHSYTGEDSTEISCHGSSYILQQVMQLLIKNGCRAAGPGEFTQRAFLNGKMDLSQAEAVADLIASTSAASHRMAMNQMRGGFSRELSQLREKLLHLTSLMELELDFSDHEELEFADRSELSQIASQVEGVINGLVQSFSVGNAIKNGIPVAIIGETNAGKSTLLNALLNEERAIVSDIHGTTRDVIEDTMNIKGILFRFIDTAGIRETSDTIESIGIERSFQKLDQASIVLWVIDSTEAETQINALKDKVIPRCEGKKLILVMNKCDMVNNAEQSDCLKELSGATILNPAIASADSGMNYEMISIAAKQGEGITELQKLLVKAAALPEVTQNDVVVSNVRHYEALSHALEAIHRVQEGMSIGLSGDLVSQDLRECLFHLAEIVGGEITNDEVLGNIFKNFCIGK
ncbi:tRNA uridine-5-carboxymethylaminomethyl(34) synthesis GTPase MnmE [Bacteroides caecigallinarum]|uniref:tRNA uridine-5-carboxymethylaminomethyl(34) synthesis GTPase MnmE n=1 Tax=Bacteroides caecigallinarum TaxID=1411144 RepID=UPI001F1DB08F|nr:tRNA uridine-5-carboxymethylaminomethyl(34) synthesis GTPase MnmE [Bacteroides caecigallinarum]MCF2551057.1 tRNA uridine-5-carboxymethylaminomethyl(34) synthesis GTPase MnmE [Bacteroides caecigallinarum]